MLPPQLHLAAPLADHLVIDPLYTSGTFSKPWGGLWTSTFAPGQGSAWLAYCARSEFRTNAQQDLSLWLLTPAPTARVLVIDKQEDIDRLFATYSLPLTGEPRSPGSLGLAWVALARDFDAFHLTQAGFVAGYPFFSTWSCESTLWFRDCFSAKQKLAVLPWAQAFDLSRSHSLAPEVGLDLF